MKRLTINWERDELREDRRVLAIEQRHVEGCDVRNVDASNYRYGYVAGATEEESLEAAARCIRAHERLNGRHPDIEYVLVVTRDDFFEQLAEWHATKEEGESCATVECLTVTHALDRHRPLIVMWDDRPIEANDVALLRQSTHPVIFVEVGMPYVREPFVDDFLASYVWEMEDEAV